jgi:hypothetical protein
MTQQQPAPAQMDTGGMIVALIEPRVYAAGHAYEGPLVAERWGQSRDGAWVVLLKLGHGSEKFGDRYMHLRGPTLYHLDLGDYFHSRATAEQAYAAAVTK